MNLRTGLKAMAVALPMAVAPMKSSAQNIAKEATQKTSQVVVHNAQGTKVLRGAEADAFMKTLEERLAQAEAQKTVYKPEPLILKGKVGAGYGLTPFMNQGVAEPKAYASVGLTNNKLNAQFDASIGKATQSYTAKVGGMFNAKSAEVEAGTVFRYNRNNPSEIKGAILESEVNSSAPDYKECISNNMHTAFWGAYITPSYKFGKAEVNANLEAGFAGFAGMKQRAVPGAAIPQAVADGRMVDRSTFALGANLGAGAKYEVAKNLKIGGDVNYSTYDRHAGFNVGATYEFGGNIRKAK